MKRLMNFLRGMAEVTATGPYPERLLNLCAQRRLDFWNVAWPDSRTLRMTVRRGGRRQLEQLAEKAGCTLTVDSTRGLPDFLLRFRRRYAFLAGLVLSLLAVGVLSRFVLTVEVTGNDRIPTAVILTELRRLGIYPGVWGPGIDRKQRAQELLLNVKELKWAAINRSGTRLLVDVRETWPVPERLDESLYRDVVAKTDGLVTHIQPELGDAAVKNGDTVAEGDLLISGTVTMEPPQYSDLPPRYYRLHARGRVWARTWRTVTAAIPLKTQVRRYTGEEKTVWSLERLGKRIEIFGNSSISWPFCDKISVVRGAGPLGLLRQETFRAYEPAETEIDRDSARAMLEGELRRYLDGLAGPGGVLHSFRCTAREREGRLEVTAQAEYEENIAKEVPGTGVIPDLTRLQLS